MSLANPDNAAVIRSFAPGFMDTPEDDTLPLGALADAKNCLLTRVGEGRSGRRALLTKRDGSRLINALTLAAGKPVDIVEYLRDDDSSELVALCNGVAYSWDGATFTAITGGGTFTAGASVRFYQANNNLVITDGLVMKRYDGTSCKPMGETAPATAPTLATGAATGVTGTYEGYWVGYDPVTDHETSPSPLSAQVVFANVKRDWTRPAHALAANYTKWRVYARRVDTSENNFFRAGEQVIGTATLTEVLSDTARRDLGVGPLTHVNDAPPVFAWIGGWKGYGIAALEDDSDYFLSKQGDIESWHPKDRFTVRRNEALRSGHPFQDHAFLLQTDARTFQLQNDRAPFQLVEAHSQFGNVCYDAFVEGPNHFYAWDKEKGPYRSDLSIWEPLADGRIETVIASVNRQYLSDIRAVHHRKRSLIIWAVPTSVNRKRTLLAYNYNLECWLPPITGLEYASLTEFTDSTGATGLYAGDYWGRVYELFSGAADGPPSGTLSAVITAATGASITASAAAFYTSGSGLAGMPVAVLSPSGAWQWARIQSNTGTGITLDVTNGPTLSPVPDPLTGNWTVVVGGIEWYGWLGRLDFDNPEAVKRGGLLFVQGAATSVSHEIEFRARFNGSLAIGKSWALTFPPGGGVWGATGSTWGAALWGASGSRRSITQRISRAFHTVQIGFRNFYPNQPFLLASLKVGVDQLARRRVSRG